MVYLNLVVDEINFLIRIAKILKIVFAPFSLACAGSRG